MLGLTGSPLLERLELRAQLSILALEQRDAPALGHEVGRQPAQRGAYLLRRNLFHRS